MLFCSFRSFRSVGQASKPASAGSAKRKQFGSILAILFATFSVPSPTQTLGNTLMAGSSCSQEPPMSGLLGRRKPSANRPKID